MFGIDDIVGVAVSTIGKVIDRVFPDPAQAAAAKLEVLKMQQTGELAELASETDLAKGQLDINKAEALGTDKFSSRWRPFLGWTCGAAFAWNFVGMPLFGWIMAAAGRPVPVGPLDMSIMMPVLLGILGLGGMRTFERVKGTVGPAK